MQSNLRRVVARAMVSSVFGAALLLPIGEAASSAAAAAVGLPIEIREWQVPAGEASKPYGMAVDAKDRLWVAESGPQPNRLVIFDPASQSFGAPTAIPSGGGTVRHMQYDPATASVWFGTDSNTIGRARLVQRAASALE